MRSILYHLMKNPNAYSRLMEEISDADKKGMFNPYLKYIDTQKLPYFQACCKEGMRIHPSVALHLPRHVPPDGCVIAGKRLPKGYRVGVNAAVLHYDKMIFGDDADEFNPDRWFREDAVNMEKYLFQFGAGPRGCIGKNVSLPSTSPVDGIVMLQPRLTSEKISLSEIHKMLPQLLKNFKLELADKESVWKVVCIWWNRQSNILVRVTRN